MQTETTEYLRCLGFIVSSIYKALSIYSFNLKQQTSVRDRSNNLTKKISYSSQRFNLYAHAVMRS